MENTVQAWSKATKSIFTGVLLYSLGGILYTIVKGVSGVAGAADDLMSLADGRMGGGIGFGDVLSWIVLAVVVIGYVMFIMGLGNFSKILKPEDSTAIGKVRTGAILFNIAYIWGLFGIWGWIGTVLNIIGSIFMIIGFSALKKSMTFPAGARKGASNLFLAILLAIIAYGITFIFSWIPLAGAVFGFIAGVLHIVAFILIIVGWAKVKSADPAVL